MDSRLRMIPEGSGDTIERTGIGTGPFIVEKFDADGISILTANTDYWEGPAEAGAGRTGRHPRRPGPSDRVPERPVGYGTRDLIPPCAASCRIPTATTCRISPPATGSASPFARM